MKAAYESANWLTPAIKLASDLISKFPASMWEMLFCAYKLHNLWYFVIATDWNKHWKQSIYNVYISYFSFLAVFILRQSFSSVQASPVVQLVRICLQWGRTGFNPWVGKIPWRREKLPTPVFWPGEFHGLYSPWGCKEWTQLREFHTHLLTQFHSVAQSCPTLCDPMDCSTPGLPVHHQLPEFTQTHVHWIGDAIQLSHPLLSPSPAFSLSQEQGLF